MRKVKSESIKKIEIGCEAVNYARGLIKLSSTHPSINAFPEKLRHQVYDSLEFVNSNRLEKMLAEIGITEPEFKTAPELRRYLSYFKNSAKESHMGNCIDFSVLVFAYLAEHYPRLPQRIHRFSKDHGDHFFNILGEGPSAVFCDAWAGVVCPLTALPNVLKDFSRIRVGDTFYNCVFSFNRNFHKVDVWLRNTLLLPALLEEPTPVNPAPSSLSAQKKNCLYLRSASAL